eukprot:TRINITY_DN11996_c0_g1_i1.p1 TRINITY_DN11996_c0_g1~~TRINITY_DN11996_c0_g1_i1.p1  ORF type:complete len:596 (+),score=99.46 TRINITY_DN11996_c0_g1_i1:208-1995(+)
MTTNQKRERFFFHLGDNERSYKSSDILKRSLLDQKAGGLRTRLYSTMEPGKAQFPLFSHRIKEDRPSKMQMLGLMIGGERMSKSVDNLESVDLGKPKNTTKHPIFVMDQYQSTSGDSERNVKTGTVGTPDKDESKRRTSSLSNSTERLKPLTDEQSQHYLMDLYKDVFKLSNDKVYSLPLQDMSRAIMRRLEYYKEKARPNSREAIRSSQVGEQKGKEESMYSFQSITEKDVDFLKEENLYLRNQVQNLKNLVNIDNDKAIAYSNKAKALTEKCEANVGELEKLHVQLATMTKDCLQLSQDKEVAIKALKEYKESHAREIAILKNEIEVLKESLTVKETKGEDQDVLLQMERMMQSQTQMNCEEALAGSLRFQVDRLSEEVFVISNQYEEKIKLLQEEIRHKDEEILSLRKQPFVGRSKPTTTELPEASQISICLLGFELERQKMINQESIERIETLGSRLKAAQKAANLMSDSQTQTLQGICEDVQESSMAVSINAIIPPALKDNTVSILNDLKRENEELKVVQKESQIKSIITRVLLQEEVERLHFIKNEALNEISKLEGQIERLSPSKLETRSFFRDNLTHYRLFSYSDVSF